MRWNYIHSFPNFNGSAGRMQLLIHGGIEVNSWHYNDVIWARRRLKSTAPWLFTQPFIQSAGQRKHKSSASLAFVTGEFPTQRASKAENVFILWRHHGFRASLYSHRMCPWFQALQFVSDYSSLSVLTFEIARNFDCLFINLLKLKAKKTLVPLGSPRKGSMLWKVWYHHDALRNGLPHNDMQDTAMTMWSINTLYWISNLR